MRQDGYHFERRVFSSAECDAVIAALPPADGAAGVRHLMGCRSIAELALDSRLLNVARQALGTNAIPFRATLFAKSAQANWLIAWHQDTALPLVSRFQEPGWGPWSEKTGVIYAHAPAWALSRIVALRVHLDASTPDNGPLRVIPKSHDLGVLDDQAVHDYAKSRDSVTCIAPRGGVFAMRPLLIHASSKAASAAPRRVLHIEYADSLDLAPAIRLAVV